VSIGDPKVSLEGPCKGLLGLRREALLLAKTHVSIEHVLLRLDVFGIARHLQHRCFKAPDRTTVLRPPPTGIGGVKIMGKAVVLDDTG